MTFIVALLLASLPPHDQNKFQGREIFLSGDGNIRRTATGTQGELVEPTYGAVTQFSISTNRQKLALRLCTQSTITSHHSVTSLSMYSHGMALLTDADASDELGLTTLRCTYTFRY